MSPLDELRALGLAIEIDADTATRIWINLIRINARVERERPEYPARPVTEAYNAIASRIVTLETPDRVLEEMIPKAIFEFCSTRRWSRYGSLQILQGVLNPCVEEWKSNRLEMGLADFPGDTSPQRAEETVGQKIDRYRRESRMTIAQLAAKVGYAEGTVSRHINDKQDPGFEGVTAYEDLFSKSLNRKIKIS